MANHHPLDSQVEPDYLTGAFYACVSVASCRTDVPSGSRIITLPVPPVHMGVTVVAELKNTQTWWI